MTEHPNDYKPLSWWERFLLLNRHTMWLGYWLARLNYRAQRAYDGLMIEHWPYDCWPNEWRSLWKKAR